MNYKYGIHFQRMQNHLGKTYCTVTYNIYEDDGCVNENIYDGTIFYDEDMKPILDLKNRNDKEVKFITLSEEIVREMNQNFEDDSDDSTIVLGGGEIYFSKPLPLDIQRLLVKVELQSSLERFIDKVSKYSKIDKQEALDMIKDYKEPENINPEDYK